jgi:hypothetical protein
LANKYANGEELSPSEFSGGAESNDFLRALGFRIVETKFPTRVVQLTLKEHKKAFSSLDHLDERCPKCKEK